MSSQLFPNLFLINKSALISEDIAFLTSFFSLQRDLPQDKTTKFWLWFFITLIFVSTCLDCLHFGPGISIVTSVLCSPYIFFNLYHLLYYRLARYKVSQSFNALCNCLGENHNLLKKLHALGQELQVIEKNCSLADSNCLKIVKSTFEVAVKLFNVLRDETKQALSLPATIEDLNREDNYISCLPNQLFEELLYEEDPTPHQLKSLMQLIRIQQSEFLRRILCVPISGPLKEKCKTLHCINYSLRRCKDKMSPENFTLQSLFAFYHSSLFGQDKHLPLNAKVFDMNYSIRSIRLHLHAAQLLLDNLEKLSTQDLCKKGNVMGDLLKIEKELNLGFDAFKALSQKYRRKEVVDELFQPIEAPHTSSEDGIRTLMIDENFKPTIEDQVFELFIDDDECLNSQYKEDNEATTEAIFDDFSIISSNLYQELKTALIPKAEETREREAKALGIPKEDVPVQLDIKCSTAKERQKITQSIDELHSCSSLGNFTATLASRAAQISKDLKLNKDEECYGDSDNEQFETN